jgi:uncharacterized protein
MKMQADRPEGSNAITRHGAEGVIVNGREHRHNVLVPWRGEVVPWAVDNFEALDEASFEALIALEPELVIFGSGSRIRFPRPALLKDLMARRIGFETMDTPAACRTYNILASEGRNVVAALILETQP